MSDFIFIQAAQSFSITVRTLLFVVVLIACKPESVVVQSYIPVYGEIGTPTQRVLILNSHDVLAQQFRENKERLFKTMLDSLLMEIATEVRLRSGLDSEVRPGLTHTGAAGIERDSIVKTYMQHHNATQAIVITFFDIYFDQIDVEVTKTESGKEREAFYDIVSNIHYSFYDDKAYSKDMQKELRRFHSSRSVISGLLAAGPNIVKNQNEAFDMTHDNMEQFLDNFYPKRMKCERPLFVKAEFSKMSNAISKNNFTKAMEECRIFVNDADRIKAAKANYNCAVLSERRNQFSKAKAYLEASLRLHPLPEAHSMMNDYLAMN